MMMNLDLTGRRAVVTGASLGIGAAAVQMLADHGAHVAFCARRQEAVDALDGYTPEGAGSVRGFVADMADRETVGLLGINIDRRFTIMFAIAAAVAGLAGVMYGPIKPSDYHMGMDFLVLNFVVVVVGGMGSLPGAVLAGFMLGILESFASMNEVKEILPGIDQIIIYIVAIIILLTRPRGLMGRKGVMED